MIELLFSLLGVSARLFRASSLPAHLLGRLLT